ncbi:MAG TPA: twin-arginine translocase subunit TatC [Gemmatimonadales bacterium]|nr:twin-arginine translocase subunit TatC [Gemmatimonadales bacterium]
MNPRGEMPFLDHLEELRWRILWSLVAILIGSVVGWLLLGHIDIIELLKRPIAPYLPGGRLIFTSPAEPFMLTVKVAFALGCVLASPVVIYQIWAFLAPALYEREKRLIVPSLAVGVILFLAGALACYRWLLPAALRVFMSFQRSDLSAMITIDRYFGMAVPFVIGCGLIAELPLVVTILASLGVVTPQFLTSKRRYAVVIAAVIAAILTPPDAVSMLLMLGPLLLLYELSIWCAWVATRRRARRMAAAVIVLLLLASGSLAAQNPPPPPPPPRPPVGRDTTHARSPTALQDSLRGGGNMDTATARRLGLPTGPTRSFPPPDSVIDSLLKLQGYRVTRYVAETLVVQGDSQTIFLRREGFVDRDGTQLEADTIRYHEASCQLNAGGDPRLFDHGTVLVGEGMRYDTCVRRGTVNDALTDFQQGGVTWYMRGNLAVDSGSTRVYAHSAKITSDPQPVPDYHFQAGQAKWINKRTMVARPAVLYVRDVPVMWLPFIFQDIRGGRRSGILLPRFGINDLVRPARSYSRHISDLGYYFAVNDYIDVLVSGDWFSDRNVSFHAQAGYRWLDRFMQGSLTYTHTTELGEGGGATNSRIGWNHSQRFDSRTDFNANLDYSTNSRLIQRNSLNPYEVNSSISSSATFNKRFSWGTLNIGGTRRQELSQNATTQTFPTINLTPTTVTITPSIIWTPTFSYSNTQLFHTAAGTLVVPGGPTDTSLKTVALFSSSRTTDMNFQTPIRIGRWNWANSINWEDAVNHGRTEFHYIDSTGAVHNVLFAETFSTKVDWQTGINLPPLLSSTWKLQPGVSIINLTGAGPFMIRNQFTGGSWVQQGKRLAFSASASPTFFGFFPGFGKFARIRHSFSPIISWQYAPGVTVPAAYARAIDPFGLTLNSHTDPQQTMSIGLSQNFEAKLKPPPGDTSASQQPRKIRILSINTSGISYNFEQAKQPHRTGWQTGSITNTFLSDLLPGFQLGMTHDLFKGQVGTDSAKFDPFMTSLTASFNVTPATLQGVAKLLGLRPRPAPPPPGPDTTSQNQLPGSNSHEFQQYQGGTRVDLAHGSPLGGGRGFSLSVGFSSTRSRFDTTAALKNAPGRRTTNLTLSFQPTRLWTANWGTQYDFATGQFAYHYVSFQRDLRRWRASFVFQKTGSGNFSFTFNIALNDQPDIRFDYDQRTYVR